MTKDRDFKRIVREQAQASGQRYTEARNRLRPPAEVEPEAPPPASGRWIIVYTFPGTEAWVSDWLRSSRTEDVARVLFPRYEDRPVAPGLLLVEVTSGTGYLGLLREAMFTSYLGAPNDPRLLSWEEVREELKREVRQRGRQGGPGLHPFSVAGMNWSPGWRTGALGDGVVAHLLDEVAAGARAREALAVASSAERPALEAAAEGGEAAKRALLDASAPLIERAVESVLGATRVPAIELTEAGQEALVRAMESGRVGRTAFSLRAWWWVREGVVRRAAETP